MFSVRIVDADFYLAKPVAGLDVLYSDFRQSEVKRVPVIRVFGATPSGQKTCLHVHQVFPYIFVPYDGTQPTSKYLKQFSTSIDFAVQVALGKATSSTHHVYDVKIVKRIPFYGYHDQEQDFIKIQFYNPRLVTRVVDLLQNGAILNKVFQPYESHIPYILQFLMDFNLYGMNLLHAKTVKFRGWHSTETHNTPGSQLQQQQQQQQSISNQETCSPPFSSNISISGSFHVTASTCQHWDENTIPSELRLGNNVSKISRCELEADVISTDILNQLEIGTSIGTNPGIAAMWEDERARRRDHGQSSQIVMPVSQDRGDLPLQELEKDFKQKIREIISERNKLVQSQIEKMDKSQVDSLSPEDFQNLSQSILLDVAEASDSPIILSNEVDENTPVVDETIIEDVLQASQSQSQKLCAGHSERDMLDILISLAEDPNDEPPQDRSATLHLTPKSASEDRDEVEDESDDNDDELSMVMSQPVWSGEEMSDNDDDDDDDEGCSQRFQAQSLLLERIPQLDGCHDDDDEYDKGSQGTQQKRPGTKRTSKCDKKVNKQGFGSDGKTGGQNIKESTSFKSKPKSTTRQRKSIVAPLDVSGGRTKERNPKKAEAKPSGHGEAATTIASEVKMTTSTKRSRKCPLIYETTTRICDDRSKRNETSTASTVPERSTAVPERSTTVPERSTTVPERSTTVLEKSTKAVISLETSAKLRAEDIAEGDEDKAKAGEERAKADEHIMTNVDQKRHEANKCRQNKSEKLSRRTKDKPLSLSTKSTKMRATDKKNKKICRRGKQVPALEEFSSDAKTIAELSSESQSSDFELRLSDSSSDDDFKRPRKFSKLLSVRKKAGGNLSNEELVSSKTTGDNSEHSIKQSSLCHDQKPFKIVERCLDTKALSLGHKNVTVRKRSRSTQCPSASQKERTNQTKKPFAKKAQTFMKETEFTRKVNTDDVIPEETSLNTQNSRQNYSTKQPRERSFVKIKRRMTEDYSTSEEQTTVETVAKRFSKGTSLHHSDIKLLDACVRLEKLPMQTECLQMFEKQVGPSETTTGGQEANLVNESRVLFSDQSDGELDISFNSLFQMGMWSPKSNNDEDSSPPRPSSPSFSELVVDCVEVGESGGDSDGGVDENKASGRSGTQVTMGDMAVGVVAVGDGAVDDGAVDDATVSVGGRDGVGDGHEGMECNRSSIPLIPSFLLFSDVSAGDVAVDESEEGSDDAVKGADWGMACGRNSAPPIPPSPSFSDELVGDSGASDGRNKDSLDSMSLSNIVDLGAKTEHGKIVSRAEFGDKDDDNIKPKDAEFTCRKESFDSVNLEDIDEDIVYISDEEAIKVASMVQADDNDDDDDIYDDNDDHDHDVYHDNDGDDYGTYHDNDGDDHGIYNDSDDDNRISDNEYDHADMKMQYDEPLSIKNSFDSSPHGNIIGDSEYGGSTATEITSSQSHDGEIRNVIVKCEPPGIKDTFDSEILDNIDDDVNIDDNDGDDIECIGEIANSLKFDQIGSSVKYDDNLDMKMKDSEPTSNDISVQVRSNDTMSSSHEIPHLKIASQPTSLNNEIQPMSLPSHVKKPQTSHLLQLSLGGIGGGSGASNNVWSPVKPPPSPSYILRTRDLYGLPHERHQPAFCSDTKDLPVVSRIVGGRRLQISSLSVEELREFNTEGNFQTLSEIRNLMGDHMDSSFVRQCLRTLATDDGVNREDDGYTGNLVEIKLALMGECDVVITPARLPPSQSDVRMWMEGRKLEASQDTVQDESNAQQNAGALGETDRTPKTPKQNRKKDVSMEIQDIENSSEAQPSFQTPHSTRLSSSQLPRETGNVGSQNRFGSTVVRGPKHSTPLAGSGQDTPLGNDRHQLGSIRSPLGSGRSSLGNDRSMVGSGQSVIVNSQNIPVGNGRRSGSLFRCSSIEPVMLSSQNEGSVGEKEVELTFVADEQCQRIENLRRNILTSQVKNVAKDHIQLSVDASIIEGPTPNNSCGFKISQPNIQEAKSLHEMQFLTHLSVELHIRTRKKLRPDPEYDPICAIFYHIEHETRDDGKQYVTGVIVARRESTKLTKTDSEPSTSIGESKEHSRTHMDTTQGTSGDSNFLRSTGLVDSAIEVITVDQETDAILRFVDLVHQWDPDILIGFEIQMLSLGYLLQRSTTLGIDLASQLSRLQDSTGSGAKTRLNSEKDWWTASHASDIMIAGRIVLNVWSLMKYEVTLNVYTFENIAYHVLHERIPLYTFQQLTRWWDQKMPHNRWRTAEHYITRSQANIRILNYSDFVNRTSEFARLFGILFYSVISRGSQFRVESMMLRLAKPMNYVAVSPSIQQRARMCAPECIPLVMEPESRFYSDPVVVLDFQSLYPSMIIAYNYCYSTCLGRVSRLQELGNFEFACTSLNVPPGLLERLEDDIHVSANGTAFVKPDVREGVLPRMLKEILDTRVMVKKAMKQYKDDKVLARVLDARQLGLKLIANVTYGYTSANFSGRMPCVEIADAIVRKARETLERAIHMVNTREEWGARVVYGDTDSLFVLLKGATKEDAFKIGMDIVDAVTATNPKPVKLKFEKVYLPCVLQTKKRYVGYMYETLDQKEPVFDAKGIETVRRDSCPAVAKILEKSLRILFESKDVSLVKKFVQRQFRKLMEDRVSLQDFIFAKEYRGMRNYKPSACVPALELTRRRLSRDRRAEPRVGERVPYVVVCGSPGLPLIQLVRSPDEVLGDVSLRLNASYYITKQISPPLNRVFSLVGIDVSTWYTELPRFVPRQHIITAGKQKSSISRYFTTLHCPVCEELTNQGLCHSCRMNPQHALVTLADRIRNWERKYDHLAQICFQCCGTRDSELSCVSFDCPVLFKRTKSRRNLSYAETLREVQRKIETENI